MKSQRYRGQELLSLWSWSEPLCWLMDVFTNLEFLWTHTDPEIFMEASSHRHDRLLLNLWCVSPPGADNSKFLIMAWAFWWLAPIQKPPRVNSLEQKPFLLPRKFQRIYKFYVKYSYHLHHWGDYKDVRNFVRNWGQRSNISRRWGAETK